METIRDIVVIVFSVTGTVASVVYLIMGLKLYGSATRALENVDRVSDDIHEAADGVRSGVRVAKEFLGSIFPGPRVVEATYRVVTTVPRAVRFISRFRRPPA